MYKQLVTPNLNTVGKEGYCLAYARSMFAAPGGTNYAWDAWQAAKYKHTDRNLPTDAAVLMYYSYVNNGIKEGHVTVSVPGKGIYSSPVTGTGHGVYGSIAEIEQHYTTHFNGGTQPVVYVGWSEDINGLRVAEPQEEPVQTITKEEVIWHYRTILGRDPSEAEANAYAGKDYHYATEDIKKYACDHGQDYRTYKTNNPAGGGNYTPYVGQQLFVKKG